MCLSLDGIEKECPRLVLCTTQSSVAQRLARHIKIFDAKGALRPGTAARARKPSEMSSLTAGVDAQRRRSTIRGGGAAARKSSSPPKMPVVNDDQLMELIFTVEPMTDDIGTSCFALACIGAAARSALIRCVERSNAVATWVHIDALTHTQVIRHATEVGEPCSGFLIKCLEAATAPLPLKTGEEEGGSPKTTPGENRIKTIIETKSHRHSTCLSARLSSRLSVHRHRYGHTLR